jgi:hypothetical protein
MMRRVRDQAIVLHGSYRFANREQLYAAIVAARELLAAQVANAPLQMSCSVIGETELQILVKVPMFEENDFAATLFSLVSRAARSGKLETRVDVV